jgi:hypothetical protein
MPPPALGSDSALGPVTPVLIIYFYGYCLHLMGRSFALSEAAVSWGYTWQ